MKYLAFIALIALGILGGTWLAFRFGFFDTDDEMLMAKYGAGSTMVEIDGVRFRMQDEGQGYPVMLLHGALGNLNFWDSWAEALVDAGYRVIRFDGPPEGLSDIDPKGHTHARLGQLAMLLADRLDLKTFAIGGTSRGGQSALLNAATHPDRVTHLVLTQTPVFKYSTPPPPKNVVRQIEISGKLLSGYRPTAYWRAILGNLFEDQSALTDDIIQQYADFANRKGHRERIAAVMAQSNARDKDNNRALAGSIKVPTLILATPNDWALSLDHQKELASWFSEEVRTFAVMDVGGHFPPLERGKESAAIVVEFLDTHIKKDPEA